MASLNSAWGCSEFSNGLSDWAPPNSAFSQWESSIGPTWTRHWASLSPYPRDSGTKVPGVEAEVHDDDDEDDDGDDDDDDE